MHNDIFSSMKMWHRAFISIILCLFPLLGNGQSLLPKDVQTECIKSLSPYLIIDSARIRKLSSNYRQAGLPFDSIAYFKNVKKVYSIAKKGIELCKNDKALELLSLLDKNKECFYKHPASNIYQEADLHWTFIALYSLRYKDKKLIRKQVELWEHTYGHILDAEIGKLQYHPLHYDILLELIGLYYELGDLSFAIRRATNMCEFISDIDGTGSEAYKASALTLSKLYREAGDINKADSYLNISK